MLNGVNAYDPQFEGRNLPSSQKNFVLIKGNNVGGFSLNKRKIQRSLQKNYMLENINMLEPFM